MDLDIDLAGLDFGSFGIYLFLWVQQSMTATKLIP
jgi:hypothetical protein